MHESKWWYGVCKFTLNGSSASLRIKATRVSVIQVVAFYLVPVSRSESDFAETGRCCCSRHYINWGLSGAVVTLLISGYRTPLIWTWKLWFKNSLIKVLFFGFFQINAWIQTIAVTALHVTPLQYSLKNLIFLVLIEVIFSWILEYIHRYIFWVVFVNVINYFYSYASNEYFTIYQAHS